MKYSACVLIKYTLSILSLLLPLKILAADVYGPKSFDQILESDFTKTLPPNPISAIQNRGHVLLVDVWHLWSDMVSKSGCLGAWPDRKQIIGIAKVRVESRMRETCNSHSYVIA